MIGQETIVMAKIQDKCNDMLTIRDGYNTVLSKL